jgi:hypothetical protein
MAVLAVFNQSKDELLSQQYVHNSPSACILGYYDSNGKSDTKIFNKSVISIT